MTSLKNELRRRIRPGHAESLAWFFKAGPGEYGAGDRFLGIRVPEIRAVAKIDDGRSDVRELERFLDARRRSMPRTMLRYAIEKFPEKRRKQFLAK